MVPDITASSTRSSPNYAALESPYDYKPLVNQPTSAGTQGPLVLSSLYGKASSFQAPRVICLNFKFIF